MGKPTKAGADAGDDLEEGGMSELEVVERRLEKHGVVPTPRGTKWQPIIDTAKTGKAVRIALNGRHYRDVENNIRTAIRKKGYHLRYRRDGGDHLICWAEPRDTEEGK